MTCRWDRDAEEYLNDGEPCRTDDYGDPTRHCTARRSCAQHVGEGEITCARCVGRTRVNIRRIVELAPLMHFQALDSGTNSDAAYLAGPAADVREWSARRIAMRGHLDVWFHLGRFSEKQLLHARAKMEDDDERHPYTVLTRWQMMISEDYGHPMPDHLTTIGAGDYLERNLPRIAQDPEQDFALLAREARDCREHLEAVVHNSANPTRGAPCPECKAEGKVIRLHQEFGHWCERPECTQQFHFIDDAGDRWVCPRKKEHWMTGEGYAEMIKTRTTPSSASA
jgi:hypothetical protein